MTNELAIRILTGDVLGTSEQTQEAVTMAVKALSQPERKRGHWIPWDEDDCYECSVCGVLWVFNDGTPEENEANFCPKCGADLRGGSHVKYD